MNISRQCLLSNFCQQFPAKFYKNASFFRNTFNSLISSSKVELHIFLFSTNSWSCVSSSTWSFWSCWWSREFASCVSQFAFSLVAISCRKLPQQESFDSRIKSMCFVCHTCVFWQHARLIQMQPRFRPIAEEHPKIYMYMYMQKFRCPAAIYEDSAFLYIRGFACTCKCTVNIDCTRRTSERTQLTQLAPAVKSQ